jgi:hypothetical protein
MDRLFPIKEIFYNKTNWTKMKLFMASLFVLLLLDLCYADDISEKVYALRPKVSSATVFGTIGPMGIIAYIEKGIKVTVQGSHKGSREEGKVKPGEVILSINNTSLKGKNPFVVLGKAITTAENLYSESEKINIGTEEKVD